MKKVLIFGIFDGPHNTHETILKEAKKHGDYLIVVVAQDHITNHLLGHYPTVNFAERFERLKEEDGVDKVVIGDSEFNTWRIVEQYKPDVVVFGKDQEIFKHDLEFNSKKLSERPEFLSLASAEEYRKNG